MTRSGVSRNGGFPMSSLKCARGPLALGLALLAAGTLPLIGQEKAPQRPLRTEPRPVAADQEVKYDYDLVYVRAPRVVTGPDGKERQAPVWPNAADPTDLRAPTDLVLLHPDGKEEVLVAGGPGGVADPYVSF